MRADKHTKPSGSAAKRVLKGVGKVLGTMVLVLFLTTLIFALNKTFFRRNTDVFQGKMTRRSAKRPAARVRWALEEYTLGTKIFQRPRQSLPAGKMQPARKKRNILCGQGAARVQPGVVPCAAGLPVADAAVLNREKKAAGAEAHAECKEKKQPFHVLPPFCFTMPGFASVHAKKTGIYSYFVSKLIDRCVIM